MNRARFIAALYVCIIFFVAEQAVSQTYVLIDLGVANETYSIANDINDDGQVTGYRNVNDIIKGYFWDGNQFTVIEPPGGTNSQAYGINNTGQVTGLASDDVGHSLAFRWNAQSGMETLDILDGYLGGVLGGVGRDINDAGAVVGEAWSLYVPLNSLYAHAVRWSLSGEMTVLHPDPCSAWSYATGINNSGQISIRATGNRCSSGSNFRAYLWDAGDFIPIPGLGSSFVQAYALNNKAELVGLTETASGDRRGFMWSFTEGTVDIGTLSGETRAQGINDKSEVVGYSTDTANNWRAVFWHRDTGLVDLNTLGNFDGWVLAKAFSINNASEIVGFGYFNGAIRAFKLSPVDDDDDNDGVSNDADNCPTEPNADQADFDDDSIGDVCDQCPADFLNDVDSDGLCADVDNCPSLSNSDQIDHDGDGQGDSCDDDDDNDNVDDVFDNCPYHANENQADHDGDGIGNVCDSDVDGDGVTDDIDYCTFTNIGDVINTEGCSIDDLCPCEGAWTNHGAYVSCVVRISKEFLREGLLDRSTQRDYVRAAAQAECR